MFWSVSKRVNRILRMAKWWRKRRYDRDWKKIPRSPAAANNILKPIRICGGGWRLLSAPKGAFLLYRPRPLQRRFFKFRRPGKIFPKLERQFFIKDISCHAHWPIIWPVADWLFMLFSDSAVTNCRNSLWPLFVVSNCKKSMDEYASKNCLMLYRLRM